MTPGLGLIIENVLLNVMNEKKRKKNWTIVHLTINYLGEKPRFSVAAGVFLKDVTDQLRAHELSRPRWSSSVLKSG